MKKFSLIRFIFALLVAGGIVWLTCSVQRNDPFSIRHISDGLFFAAGIEFVYSMEFMHTIMGHQASVHGASTNMYHRVKSNMDSYRQPEGMFIYEYLASAVIAALAGTILIFVK